MSKSRLQNVVLIVLVAALIVTVARIYDVHVARVPQNLQGHSTTEGGTTANPPALTN